MAKPKKIEKVTVCINIDPTLKKKVKAVVAKGEFNGGISGYTTRALESYLYVGGE